ncbi:hypothetical protein ACJIZ3_018436 [Penstemon smallii]|uniref:Uncharacterized protein n=1 Tax=Penstemon smallii TaxID=265156 RepID=A0ABD3SYD0_9LAMI
MGNWTEEQDEILRDAVQRYKGHCWKKIAACFTNKTDVQCLHRWQKVLDPNLVKGPWSKEEDDVIIEFVGKQGNRKWSQIARHLPGRIGKQCRERWYNHLDPAINKSAWTKEEEIILINAHDAYGNKWAEIAKLLPGRTDNSVKNYWNCSLKKKINNYLECGSALHDDETEKTKCVSKEIMDRRYNNELCSRLNWVLEYSHKPRLINSTPDQEISSKHEPQNLNSPVNMSHSSADMPYPGLCYKPPQKEDLEIYLSTGRFPSSESFIRIPNSSTTFCASTSHMKSLSESCSSPLDMLRRTGENYDNVPSILQRPLQKCASAPEKIARFLNMTVAGNEYREIRDDQLERSHKYQRLEKMEAIKSVGKCLEQAFSDA